jgi:hypothetical protein
MTSILTTGYLIVPNQVYANPWSWQTSLSVTERYDDNIFLCCSSTETTQKGDFLTTLSPGLRLMRLGEQLKFTSSYRANLDLYPSRSYRNTVSQTGQIGLTVLSLGPGLLQRANFDLTDSFTATDRLVNFSAQGNQPANNGVVTQTGTTLTNTGSATLSFPFTDNLSASASYNRSFTRFNAPGLVDTATQEATASFSDRVTPRISAGAIYSFNILDFQVRGGGGQYTHELSIFINTIVTQTINLGLQAGEAYFTENNSHATIGSATLTKHFEYIEATASYTRSVSTGGGLFTQPTRSQTASAQIRRVIGERADALLSGSYSNQRSVSAQSGTVKSLIVSASVNYRILQWLQASSTYRRIDQRATAQDGSAVNIRDNTIVLTLNGTWEGGTSMQTNESGPGVMGSNL